MASKHRLAVLASVLALTVSTAAFAEPSPADKETARSLMEDGDAKRDKNDLPGALKSYEAADAIMKVPTTGLEVGKVQAALGLLLEARDTLNRVIRSPATPGEPPPFTAARKNAETLSNELAERIPSLQVVVTGADPAAPPTVIIDNETIPAAAVSVPRKVNPGAHVVVVRAGTVEKREGVTVLERETKTVSVDLRGAPPPAPPPHKGRGSNPGGILMIGGFGLGLIGIAVGSVTGLISISKTNELKDACPNDLCPPNRQSDIDSAQSLGNISTISFVVGAVGVVVGVVGIVVSSGRKSEPAPVAAKLHPVVGPTYMGLGGTF